MLAVDLDGTLLPHGGAAHEADVRAIRALLKTGAHVTITTGRLYSGTREVAALCGITGVVGCVDGVHLVQAGTHQTMAHHGIAGAEAAHLRTSLERHGPATFLFARDSIVHDVKGLPWINYVATWSNELRPTVDVLGHPAWADEAGVSALVSIGTRAQITAVLDELPPGTTAIHFPIRSTQEWGLVARAAARDKGAALREIAALYEVPIEQTVAVGDWLNDVPLLRAAGRSFAMGHAPPEVKSVATDHLEQHAAQGGGVARAIELAFGVTG